MSLSPSEQRSIASNELARRQAALEFRPRMDQLMLGVAYLLDQPDPQDLLDVVSYAHAVAPIVDPTAYIHGAENLRWQETVLLAVKSFQKALEPVRVEIAKVRDKAAS